MDKGRRGFLSLLTATTVTGCMGSEEGRTDVSEPVEADTDGDGVPDERDYAPKDPDVQSKSDVAKRATRIPRTPSTTPVANARADETPTSTPESAPRPEQSQLPTNRIEADVEPLVDYANHFVSYSLRDATVRVYPQTLDNEYPRGARVVVVAAPYAGVDSGESVLTYSTSDLVSEADSEFGVTVGLDFADAPTDAFYLVALLIPGDESVETAADADVEKLCESDRLVVDGALEKDSPAEELESLAQATFTRVNAEGCYRLEFEGTDAGKSWRARFVVYKNVYADRKSAVRDPNRASYVTSAQAKAFAATLGAILQSEAEANDFSTKRELAGFAISFAQSLPYIPDDVGTGYDDYTKSMTETLVEGGGDCEDSSILLAALLQSPSFNYDCVLLRLPGHMAVGVYGDDLPGSYYEYDGRDYYYVETTGEGWNVGEIPSEFRNEQAYVTQV